LRLRGRAAPGSKTPRRGERREVRPRQDRRGAPALLRRAESWHIAPPERCAPRDPRREIRAERSGPRDPGREIRAERSGRRIRADSRRRAAESRSAGVHGSAKARLMRCGPSSR
jgi:hypothetical protein